MVNASSFDDIIPNECILTDDSDDSSKDCMFSPLKGDELSNRLE
jgi:hypothetical protein